MGEIAAERLLGTAFFGEEEVEVEVEVEKELEI